MASVSTTPMKLSGPWTSGFVLECQHTVSSEFLGHDSFGHPQFDTKYSALGELIYRLKNRDDRSTIDSIADTAVQFINGSWKPEFDLIVPMPPSRKRAAYQPVFEIVNAIGARLGKSVALEAIIKAKDTPQLKDVFDFSKREKLLKDAFVANENLVRGRSVLLVDDLFRSGATANIVTRTLLSVGVAKVHVLAMTKTRTKR
jgi:competence protein ComFC